MYSLIEIIFGDVFANKIRLKVGATHKNPITLIIMSFIQNAKVRWEKAGTFGKMVMTVIALQNFFLFSGLFTMIWVLFFDFCLFRYITRAK